MTFSDTRPGAPADTAHYALAADGGLEYIPLTVEGEKTGAGARYADAPCHTGTLTLGDAAVTYALPKGMTAYDPVPLRYTLSCPDRTKTLHLSVTAFEEAARRTSPSFDLNLPGTVDVTFSYLGYVAGQVKEGVHPTLSPEFDDRQGMEFPGFSLSPECCCGDLPAADRLWLHFALENTGNTILDGEGSGSFMIEPVLLRRNEAGEYTPYAVPSNLFYRLFAPLYPGEKTDLLVTCGAYPGYPAPPGALPPGEYRLRLTGICRSEQKQPDFARVVWSGTPASVSFFDFTISAEPADRVPAPVVKQPPVKPNRNGWLHRYEEFLSSFVTSTARQQESEEHGVLAVQPAPWTRIIVLRLMQGDDEAVAEVCLPVTVESESLTLTLSPNHPGTVRQGDGTRLPAVVTQCMADMRGGAALTPNAAGNILDSLDDMRAAGVNLVATTVAFAMETGNPPLYKRGGARDAFKFMADARRVLKLPMEGLISYPFSSGETQQLASAIRHAPVRAARGIADPALTEACKEAARYEFLRYGDNYWQLGDGRVPLCVEDTRGWIRYDQHNRYPEGEASTERFRLWLRERYGSVEAVNAAWGSRFADFADIDPEKDGAAGAFGHKFEYHDPAACFHDYSAAMLDWDRFRTALRREQYRDILAYVRPLLPRAAISLRTEGANWLVAGIPWDSGNPKYRHIRYSQLHNGMWAEELLKDGAIAVHSDYTTLPYTPTEVAELTRMSIEQGVIPMHMPQFNRMRDIALNPRWGSDAYTVSYHLKTPMKGAYVNTLTALFPWFRATAENGGIPGVLWQDYLCDGYVTETQYRELCFFRDKLELWLKTAEGQELVRTPPPDDSFRAGTKALWSYDPAFVRKAVEAEKRTNTPSGQNERTEAAFSFREDIDR